MTRQAARPNFRRRLAAGRFRGEKLFRQCAAIRLRRRAGKRRLASRNGVAGRRIVIREIRQKDDRDMQIREGQRNQTCPDTVFVSIYDTILRPFTGADRAAARF